jgi:hypothetical protein
MFSVDWKLSVTQEWSQEKVVLARKLLQQRSQHYKSVLGSSPSEDVLSSLEITQDRRMMQRANFFVSVRILHKPKTAQNLSLGERVLFRDIF